MTNEEILETEKVIASLKNDLTVIAGTAEEELPALVLEKAPSMINSFRQIRPRRSAELVSVEDLSRFQNGLSIMMALAEMAQRRPDYNARLIDAVAKQVPVVDAILDKVGKALMEKPGEEQT